MSNRTKPTRNPYHIPSLYLQLLSPLKLLARMLDYIFSLLLPHNPTTQNITIIAISDTHTLIPKSIPHGDILIHAGDLINAGTPTELQAQIDWLSTLPHEHKIVIAGNHDTYLDPRSRKTLSLSDQDETINWKDIIYLQDNSITLSFPHRNPNRPLTFFKLHGSPHVPLVGGPEHAFQYPLHHDSWMGKIPKDTDILITHSPPKGYLDLPGVRAMGDEFLLREVRRVKPLVHVFGHIHAGRSDVLGAMKGGQEVVRWDEGERWFAEVVGGESAENFLGAVVRLADLRVWGSFGGFVLCRVGGLVRERVLGWEGPPRTRMVNAAQMFCDEGRLGNEPQVIHL